LLRKQRKTLEGYFFAALCTFKIKLAAIGSTKTIVPTRLILESS